MAQKMSTNQFKLSRGSPDRRTAMLHQPPFSTEEGLVLIDRRDQVERRGWGGAGVRSDWFNTAAHTKAL